MWIVSWLTKKLLVLQYSLCFTDSVSWLQAYCKDLGKLAVEQIFCNFNLKMLTKRIVYRDDSFTEFYLKCCFDVRHMTASNML